MRRATLAAALAVAVTMSLYGQQFRATVTGRIMDSQEAVIPGVKVRLVSEATGSRHETVSGQDGLYTAPFLSPGLYSVTVEAGGFKRYVREGVQVSTNERLTLDIRLEVGDVVDTVTVSADAPILQTATASIGQVINSRTLENMPLNGRTPLVLAQLAMGVIPPSDPRNTRPFDNAGPAGISMGGGQSQSNELLLDGAPDSTRDGRVAYNPPMDAVSELKVESFQADAAYGHTGGGTVNVVMKGGTNQFHGTAYNFNQHWQLAATPFFSNLSGQEKAKAKYNQWGLTQGGPIVIPKIINGRNRLFFFFAYEGVSNTFSRPSTTTVPTVAQKTGNFSDLLAQGGSYQLYNPFSGVVEGARVRRQPFPNNVIPTTLLNPIAQKYLAAFWPEPNQAGRADGANNYFNPNNGETNGFNNELGRLDFNASDRHKMFFNFRHNIRYGSGSSPLGQPISSIPSAGGSIRENWGSVFDDVYTFTPTMLLNTRLAWTRYNQLVDNYSRGYDMTSLGFPASLQAASRSVVLPQISIDSYGGVGASAGGPQPEDIFQIFSTLTKITGKHNLKFGVDLRQYRNSQTDFGSASGSYTFGTNWTRGPLDNAAASPLGQGFAAFLLGLPTSGQWDNNGSRTNSAGYYSFFIQDDFRPTRTLTLNIGLRYEVETPTTERYNRTTNGFDQGAASPISAQALAAYARNPIAEIPAGAFRVNGGLLFAGPGNRELYTTSKKAFSPRLGIAWTPSALGGKTVLRTGAGIFYFPYDVTGFNQNGFNQRTPLVPTNDGFLTPFATLNNPFPNGLLQPIGASQGLGTNMGQGVNFYNANPAAPYSLRWNFDIQRELSGNMVLEVGYTGNHSLKQPVSRQLNFIPLSQMGTGLSRDQTNLNRLTANVANPFAGLIPDSNSNGSTVQRRQLLMPFPQFTGVTAQDLNDGSAYFQQLQVRLEKRFSQGLQLLANYSYSKMTERDSRLNLQDEVLERRPASEDRPQRFVASASYELPFGRGKSFGSSLHPVLNQIVGGWVVNSIYTIQIGPVLSWGNLIYLGGDLNMQPRNIDRAFDTTQFNTVPAQQLDTNSQLRYLPTRFANIRGDGVNNIDISFSKEFGIFERLKLKYQCEFFNAFNHPTFGTPNLTATGTTFGQITSQQNAPRAIQMALRLAW